MAISRIAVREFLDRDLDDFRWIKSKKRSELMAELNNLRVPPVFKTRPWLHQLQCFFIGICEPRFLFLLDMGAGKTKILSDLMTQARREKRMKHALVGLPRLMNIDSWMDDLAVHSDLEPWAVNCSDIEEKRERLLNPKGDVTLIDYQGLHLALCDKAAGRGKKQKLVANKKIIAAVQAKHDFVAWDEAHKLANHDSLWFDIAKRISDPALNAYGSTGTLFGSEVTSAWAPFYLVDGGETLGENLGLFKASFFTARAHDWKGEEYIFDRGKTRLLNRTLQHRSIRYEESEMMDLPLLVPRLARLEMSEEQREHYMRALEGLVNAGGNLKELEGPFVRMRQITSGYLAWSDGSGDHVVRFKKNPKLDRLQQLVEEMGDSKIVICYDYTETGRMIVDRLKEMGVGHDWYWGGTKDKSAVRARFMTDPSCRVLVMNSSAGGTGNDGLQKVARYMVFYESPTSPTDRKQTQKRIHRPGQTERSFIWDLVIQRSLDAGILERIREGIDIHEQIVDGKKPLKSFFLTSLAA